MYKKTNKTDDNEVVETVNDISIEGKDNSENTSDKEAVNDSKEPRKFNKSRNNRGKKNNKELEPQIDTDVAKMNSKRIAVRNPIAETVTENKKTNKQPQQSIQSEIKQNKPKGPKPIKEMPVVSNKDKDKLMLAKNKNTGNSIYLPTKHRKANLMVLGLSSSGKTSAVLPLLANQDFKNKDVGCTLFLSDEEMVFKLFALAKYYKRQVVLVKPSTELEVLNNFLWLKEYNYKYIKENIIDFEDAILKKKIVIVDMEYFKYRDYAKEAVIKLLTQYQVEMYNALQSPTRKKFPTNYLYVDDADLYIKELQPILEYGKSYNVNTTILMKNRDLLVQDGIDYRPMVESNIRNYIIMNGVGLNDAKYFSEKYSKTINDIIGRKNGEIMYEILDESNSLAIGQGVIYQIDIEIIESIEKSAIKTRKQKIKFCKKSENKLNKNKKTEDNKKEIHADEIMNTVKDAVEPYSDTKENYHETFEDDYFSEETTDEDKNAMESLSDFIPAQEETEEQLLKNEDVLGLTDTEKDTVHKLEEKYEGIEFVQSPENKRDPSEIMESIMNSRHYLDPEKINFNE